jgi:hypothetical protein
MAARVTGWAKLNQPGIEQHKTKTLIKQKDEAN